MYEQYIYFDEYGTPDIEVLKNNVTDFYIITAVVVPCSQLDEATILLDRIKAKYFKQGEIKSTRITNDNERYSILSELLSALSLSISMAVDKRKIHFRGSENQRTFYKYTHRLLHEELFKNYGSKQFIYDTFGKEDFVAEYQKYLDKHYNNDLFTQFDFQQQKSKDNIFIQSADFICGTIAKIYDKMSPLAQQYYSLFMNNNHIIRMFPELYTNKLEEPSGSFDKIISDISAQKATDHIEDTDDDMERKCLMRLLRRYFESPGEYVQTNELIHCLQTAEINEEDNKINSRKVMSLIGHLRDKGVLIASSQAGGYKIPVGEADIIDFVKHFDNKIIPMVERVNRIKQIVSTATNTKLDILKQFPKLSNCCKQLLAPNDPIVKEMS